MTPLHELNEPAVMVDLETLDTRPTAAIWQLAAVVFIPASGEIRARHFCDIDVDDALMDGCTIGRDTFQWWEDRGGIQQDTPIPHWEAIDALRAFIRLNLEPGGHIWARGSDFDFPILKHAFCACDVTIPWRYGAQHDQRTTCWLAGIEIDHAATTHNALEDCEKQIADLHRALLALGLASVAAAPVPHHLLIQ